MEVQTQLIKNQSSIHLIYNINLFGKNISMLIKGQKAQYSSLHKKIDTVPLNSRAKPKPALSKAPSPVKIRPFKPIGSSKAAINRKLAIERPKTKEYSQAKQESTLTIKASNIPKNGSLPSQLTPTQRQLKIGQIIIRYNHYKDPFKIVDGVLSFQDIQDKYGFADVFKGKLIPLVKNFKNNQQIPAETCGIATDYTWNVQQGQQYRLQIEQDKQEEAKYERKAYKAPQRGLKHCPCNLKNQAFHDLTPEMKKLQAHQLGGARHRQLLEQRDLQDILFNK